MARAKRHMGWTRLDNAAKIFPPTSGKRDPKVFRFACELYEDVQPAALAAALDKTLQSFKGFLTVLRHGFFWYYLETTDMRPVVHEENSQICSPLYDKNETSLLFDVSYFKKRINLEVYHALADGSGALELLRALVCNYLALIHDELGAETLHTGYDASNSEKMADSFQKYYDPKNKIRGMKPFAYKIGGPRLSENRIKVIEGIMPVDRMLALARERSTTLTVLLAALLMIAIQDGMTLRERKKPITLSIPVNLRKYFPSESSRNFFGIINISYRFGGGEADLDKVIQSLGPQLEEKLTNRELSGRLSSMVSMEKNAAIRAIPLLIKDFGMKAGYEFADLSVTGALSNLGQVKMPAAFGRHIRLFDVMTSTKKLQICMCSFGNNLVVNFADSFVSADIQKYFFRTLSQMGIPIEIVSNPVDDGRGQEK